MAARPDVNAVVIGQRVALKEAEGRIHPAGTVRYVGEVDGHKGVWVGIEWDNPSRGRHDGEVQGKRYFRCSVEGENSASFVRPQKLQHGVTLYDALMEQYTVTRGDYKGAHLSAKDWRCMVKCFCLIHITSSLLHQLERRFQGSVP